MVGSQESQCLWLEAGREGRRDGEQEGYELTNTRPPLQMMPCDDDLLGCSLPSKRVGGRAAVIPPTSKKLVAAAAGVFAMAGMNGGCGTCEAFTVTRSTGTSLLSPRRRRQATRRSLVPPTGTASSTTCKERMERCSSASPALLFSTAEEAVPITVLPPAAPDGGDVVDGSSESAFFPFPLSQEEINAISVSSKEGGGALEAGDETNNKEGALPSWQQLVDVISEKIGKVDESRLIYPELSSGEVPRMWSNLKYKREKQQDEYEDQPLLQALHASGSTLGAATLVAGTTVGAGVLALPTVAAPAGFLPSTAGLTVAWVYMVISGLLIAELSLNRIVQTGKPGKGLLELYEASLGKTWGLVGSTAYFFLHYAMMVAYLAQGGSNLATFLPSVSSSSGIIDSGGGEGGMSSLFLTSLQGALSDVPGLPQILFATLTGATLFLAPPKAMERVNNALVLGVVASFLGLVGLGAGTADYAALVDPINQHPGAVVDAFPIFFLALVYHNIVPTIVTQLEGNREKITKAIVGGTVAPFVMFVLWNAIILGNAYAVGGDVSGGIASGTLDPIALLQAAGGGGEEGQLLGNLVGCFSELAVVTSLIGFVYGLSDAWTDVFDLPSSGPKYDQWKPLLFAGIFIPPLVLSVGDPDIFLQALSYGGAFGVSTLFLVLPPVMVWKMRYREVEEPLATMPLVPGGKISLGSLWKVAATLIVEQGADKLGVVDWVRELVSSMSSTG